MVDFTFTAPQETWRKEIQTWIRQEFGANWNGFVGTEDEEFEFGRAVRKKLAAKGWTAPAWPTQYGGLGLGFAEQAIFNEELAYHRVPGPDLISVGYVGPTVLAYGTEDQKKEHVQPIVDADRYWCQGYSEPGAGSDLASLQTRAVRDGDDYVVNGQKIWTSFAHKADWMFLMVRTDPDAPKHKGITYLLMDVHTPGVQVRPLVNMLGQHHFNEVFFEDARVPVRNRVGEENRGWYVGMATMDFERSAISGYAAAKRNFEDFLAFLAGHQRFITPGVRTGVADVDISLEVARMLSLRVLSMQEGGLAPNHEASIAKMFSSELSQRFARFGVGLLGPYGALREADPRALFDGRFAESVMATIPSTIAGGTSEIQRNIVATRGLGLPRA